MTDLLTPCRLLVPYVYLNRLSRASHDEQLQVDVENVRISCRFWFINVHTRSVCLRNQLLGSLFRRRLHDLQAFGVHSIGDSFIPIYIYMTILMLNMLILLTFKDMGKPSTNAYAYWKLQ